MCWRNLLVPVIVPLVHEIFGQNGWDDSFYSHQGLWCYLSCIIFCVCECCKDLKYIYIYIYIYICIKIQTDLLLWRCRVQFKWEVHDDMRDVSYGHLKFSRVLPPQQAHQLADWWRGLRLTDWWCVASAAAIHQSSRLQSQPHLEEVGGGGKEERKRWREDMKWGQEKEKRFWKKKTAILL